MEDRDRDRDASREQESESASAAETEDVCDTGPEGEQAMTPAGGKSAPAEGARTDDGHGIGCSAELKTENTE